MNEAQKSHSLILGNRKRAEICGISSVGSFDENQVVLDTTLGVLTVDGHELHIVKLDLDRGEVVIEGKICGAIYSDEEEKSRGRFFSRLVR